MAPLMGIQPRVPSVRHHYQRMDRRSLSPSGVGVCDRVAVNKELEDWKGRRGGFLQQLIHCSLYERFDE